MTNAESNLIIIGAGRHAAETFDYYNSLGKVEKIICFMEENSKRENELFCSKPIYDLNRIGEFSENKTISFIIAIGSPVRKRLVNKLSSLAISYDILIADQIYKSNDLLVGEGTILCPGSIYTVNVKIGKHCIINVGSSINHDCVIGDFVTISPRVTLAGKVTIEDEVFIGVGATVIDGIRVGKGAFIAAGACVVKDVMENEMVGGVPAKFMKRVG